MNNYVNANIYFFIHTYVLGSGIFKCVWFNKVLLPSQLYIYN